jgi:hypothetical protein
LTIKSERGWSKCSYPFRPSPSGSRRTESTQDHCSSVLPWRSVYNSCISHTMLGIGTCNALRTAWEL